MDTSESPSHLLPDPAEPVLMRFPLRHPDLVLLGLASLLDVRHVWLLWVL